MGGLVGERKKELAELINKFPFFNEFIFTRDIVPFQISEDLYLFFSKYAV